MFFMKSLVLIVFGILTGQTVFVDSFLPVDLTLQSGASGEDVFDACIQKIENAASLSNVLKNDFGFFKRIALVESNFGKTSSPAFPLGGIWQISPSILTKLRNIPSSFNTLLNAFSTAFGATYIDFTVADFRVPLRSAIAARILLETQLQSNENFPGTVAEQANWWVARYNSNGQTQTFITEVQNFERINPCRVSTLDLWFLIDGSGSIGPSNFQTCLHFVNQTAAGFSISPEEVRTGLMIYSSSIVIRSLLNTDQSNQEFSRVVLSTSYPTGGTLTGAAIQQIASNGFNVANGARPLSRGVPRILVVLTDGESGDSVKPPSDNIKEMGVTVFGVGVGSGFNVAEVNEIASDPDSKFAFEFAQFNALSSVLREIILQESCKVPFELPDNTTASLTITFETITYVTITLPSNGSVELQFEVLETTSIAIVYLSESVPNPNSALYDASFTIKSGSNVIVYNSRLPTPSNTRRRKRNAETTSKPLHMAFVTMGSSPISLNFTSTPNNERASTPTSTPTPTTQPDIC